MNATQRKHAVERIKDAFTAATGQQATPYGMAIQDNVFFNLNLPVDATKTQVKAAAVETFAMNAKVIVEKNATNVKVKAAYKEMQVIIDEIMFADDATILDAIAKAGTRMRNAFNMA